MRTIWPDSESRGRCSLDLTPVPVPAVEGLRVFFVERHATPAQIRDNLPAVPGEILILKPQDLRDTSTLAVLADDILEQHSVQDIRAALMEATGKMAFLSRHFDGDVTLAFFLTYQYDPRPAELLGMWFRQFHGIEGDAS